MPIWQALGARWPAAPCPTCGTGVALALAVRATLLLFLLSPAAASADVIVLKDEGRLLSASERETWLNRARCACGAALDVVLDLSALDASGRAALVAGKSCITSDRRISDGCRTLWRGAPDSGGSTTHTVQTSADEIVGDCSGDDTSMDLALIFDAKDEDQWSAVTSVALAVDTERPAAPTGVKAVAGEGLAEVAFSGSDDTDISGYQVLCTTAAGEAALADPPTAGFDASGDRCGDTSDEGVRAAWVCAEATEGSASVTVTGLRDHQRYLFRVVAIDGHHNPSLLSNVSAATPSPEEDLWERYQRSGGNADGVGCSSVGAPGASGLLLLILTALVVTASRRGGR